MGFAGLQGSWHVTVDDRMVKGSSTTAEQPWWEGGEACRAFECSGGSEFEVAALWRACSISCILNNSLEHGQHWHWNSTCCMSYT